MTLLAAFQLLLGRLSGQQDVVVGTPIAGRRWTECESLIGLFVNMVALRTDLSGNPTFRELLSRVRRTALGAYDHQELPFEKLIEALQPERSLSRNPLVQVLFNGLTMEPPRWNVAGMSATRVLLEETPSKFDLTIYVRERNNQLRLYLSYNAEPV